MQHVTTFHIGASEAGSLGKGSAAVQLAGHGLSSHVHKSIPCCTEYDPLGGASSITATMVLSTCALDIVHTHVCFGAG